jgi:hypothetical protein
MGFLVVALLLIGIGGGLVFRQSWRRERIERLRDRARLRVIEGQMTMLRAALRLNAAEQAARRRMHALHHSDVFANLTDHENYRPW